MPETLRLVAEVLRQPSFPATELDQVKRQRAVKFDQSRTDPQDVAQRALGRHANPYPFGDPRYVPTIDESIKANDAVTPEAVKQFHSQFYGASHAELAIVGDFDGDATRKLVTELFGNWKSASAFTRVPDPFRANQPAALKFDLADKTNAILLASERLPINDLHADYPALLVANFVLGDSPSSRVWNRLREKDGLSYGAGSFFQPNPIDPNSTLGFYAIFAPDNLAKVRAGLTEELSRALKDGFTDEEITAAKEGVLQERRLARTEDKSIAGALVNQAYLGRTFATSAAIDAAIAKLTAQDVNAVLRKYVKPGDIAYVFAGDFEKKQ